MTAVGTLRRLAPSSASSVRVSLWRIPRTRTLLAIGTVAVVSALAGLAAHVYTDLLWFREVGQEQAFWTTLKWKVLVHLVIGFGTATFLLVNFAAVDRVVAAVNRQGKTLTPIPLWAYRNLVFPLAAIAGGLASSAWAAGNVWQSLLLWQHRGDFGVTDPVFHRDVGFFVFSLPLYQQVAHWLYVTLLMAGIGTVASYIAAGAIQRSWPPVVARAASTHVLGLAALLLVLMAWRYRLGQFALVLPRAGGVVPGASYTDVHVEMPMLRILVMLSLAGALLCLYTAWRRVRLPLVVAAGAIVVLLGVTVAGRGAAQALVQRFEVEPQELARERPYVNDAIAATQRAFQLDRVTVRSLPGNSRLSATAIAENRRTLENVSLWDPSVLRPAMQELQSIGEYYGFPSTTVDRYTIGGKPQLVTLGARQLDLQGLQPDARSWANERFAYTHGYGVVAAKAQQVDHAQQPGFAQDELHARRNPLQLRQPRIYFGERPDFDPPYMVLRSGRGEVEEPASGQVNRSGYHYDGPGGIQLSNPLRLAAFAVRFGDPKLFLTQTATKRSRIVLHRDARERLETLAPFLRWDADPDTAVIDGRVKFLFHGYTTSSHYPYSAPVSVGRRQVNYMRDAAQASVDAFTGRVSIYAADASDPILRAWQGAYPGLFLPASQMPPQLRAHLRYPGQLFAAQVQAYTTYHVRDATPFWTAEDAWQQPLQLAGPVETAGEIHFSGPQASVAAGQRGAESRRFQMQPAYQLARLPGDARERFMLVTPFTPRGRQNLAGYLAGSLDQRGTPRLALLSLPRDRLTIGPTQATRRILASPGVNQQLDLLNKESRDLGKNGVSRTVLGVPRVVPVGDSMLYAQPFYLIAGDNGIPRLQLVAVHVNGRVGYGPDLMAALRSVVGGG
jgi:uncharacterized membrane protein (UPF0182 family)